VSYVLGKGGNDGERQNGGRKYIEKDEDAHKMDKNPIS